MTGAPMRVGLAVVVGFVLTAAAGCAGAQKIDDLAFVSLRKVDDRVRAVDPDRVPFHMRGDAYRGKEFVEAMLSTSFDLVGAVHRDPDWTPYSRKWQCALDGDEGWMPSIPEGIYQDGKEVRPPSPPAQNSGAPIAEPRAAVGGLYFYTVYFAVRKDTPRGKAPYDLAKSPVDVCLEFGERSQSFSPTIESNVVTISAQAIEKVLAREKP